MRAQLVLSRKNLETRVQILNSLSPLQVLARGFSLTTNTAGKIMRSVAEVKEGDRVVTRLADGQFTAQVISE
jgi:exodeoxyribonuclease VII large subunit